MTLADAPARPRPRDAGRASPMSLWRLLWLELRRNAMPWMFPLLAALFVFDPFRTAMGGAMLFGSTWRPARCCPGALAGAGGLACWGGMP